LKDPDGTTYEVTFEQAAGRYFVKGGFERYIKGNTVVDGMSLDDERLLQARQEPVQTRASLDQTGLFETDSLDFLEKSDRSFRFKTLDGYATVTMFVGPKSFDSEINPVALSIFTQPPPPARPSDSSEVGQDLYEPPLRPSTLAGFCKIESKEQSPLTFEQIEEIARTL
jgi:hypothetical protein